MLCYYMFKVQLNVSTYRWGIFVTAFCNKLECQGLCSLKINSALYNFKDITRKRYHAFFCILYMFNDNKYNPSVNNWGKNGSTMYVVKHLHIL